jgi:hypothetical protein
LGLACVYTFSLRKQARFPKKVQPMFAPKIVKPQTKAAANLYEQPGAAAIDARNVPILQPGGASTLSPAQHQRGDTRASAEAEFHHWGKRGRLRGAPPRIGLRALRQARRARQQRRRCANLSSRRAPGRRLGGDDRHHPERRSIRNRRRAARGSPGEWLGILVVPSM